MGSCCKHLLPFLPVWMQSKTSSPPSRLTLRTIRPVRSPYRSSFFCAATVAWWIASEACAASRRDAAAEPPPLMALPGTCALAAVAAASALRAAASFRLRDLISDLESLREVVSSASLVCSEAALDSAVSSCFWRRWASLEVSLSVVSSDLRAAMSWSAAGMGEWWVSG